jgi:hypothetical protein
MQRTKYHRTYHFHWSHLHGDDKAFGDLSVFQDKEVVALEKLDGENNTIYSDGYLHARSLDSAHNMTRDWIKRLASILHFDIPEGWRFVFENVNYYHSINYRNLEGFAYLLSIWDESNVRLPYDEMMEYATILDLPTPKVLYRGVFDEKILRKIASEMDLDKSEGYVVTVTDAVNESDIQHSIAKFVRNDHCQPNKDGIVEHWIKNTYPNKLSNTLPVRPHYMGYINK